MENKKELIDRKKVYDPKKLGKFKIEDQDHAEELLDMTAEMIRKMEA